MPPPGGTRPGRPVSGRRASWPGARRRRRSWRLKPGPASSRLRRSGRAKIARLAAEKDRLEARAAQELAKGQAKVARHAQRAAAAAAGTGRRQSGRAPWPAERQRDVRAAAAAAARAAGKLEAALAAPAAAPPLARPAKANVTDLASRVMPLKKGGSSAGCNSWAMAPSPRTASPPAAWTTSSTCSTSRPREKRPMRRCSRCSTPDRSPQASHGSRRRRSWRGDERIEHLLSSRDAGWRASWEALGSRSSTAVGLPPRSVRTPSPAS